LMMTLLLMSSMAVSAGPPSNGDNATLQANEAWTEDTTMDGHVTVESGSTLTVSANITMATGSSITVEEGAQLVLTNGALLSDDLNAGLRVEINGFVPAVLTLNFGDIAESGVVQLKLDHVVADGANVTFTYGNTTVNASGADTVEFDVPLNGTDLEISVEAAYFTPTYVLWAKAIHSGGDTVTIPAQDIPATEAPLYWFQSGFDLHAHGDLTVTSSTLLGANISCAALCSFDGTSLTGSAPIHAASTSTVSVLSSIVSGSRTDEDIVLHDEAAITYTNSQGTGGTTDAWIRLLSERTLSTNIPNGSLDISGIGWGSSSWNDLTDANGDIVLVAGGSTNEHKRIVEWMDGAGVVHQEDASITLSISSSWGTFSTTIDAPTTSSGTMHLDLPYIAVTALEPEDSTATVNKSIGMMATVSNTGNASLSGLVNVWCYVGGEIAETTQVSVSLGAGETKDVPLSWYDYTAGERALTCKPLIPAAFNDITDLVADQRGATTDNITWEYALEVEDSPVLILIVAALGFGGLALVVAAQVKKAGMEVEDSATEPTTEDEEKVYPEND